MRMQPHALIDAVLDLTSAKNDAALCQLLDISPPIMSRIRSRRLNVSSNIILIIHEKTHMSVANIRKLIKKI